MSSDVPKKSGGSRRSVLALVLVIVVAAVAVLLALQARRDGSSSANSGASPSSEPSFIDAGGGPSGNPAGHTGAPEETDPTLAPVEVSTPTSVPLDETAPLAQGVVVSVVSVESVEGVASGPGEVAGPALRVTVSVQNDSETAVSLADTIVNLSYGPDSAPADVLSGPGAEPFPQRVEPGETATSVSVFGVPADQQSTVTVELVSAETGTTLLFTGAPQH